MVRNDRWGQLSIKQRADLIKLYVESGITDLNEIKRHYNNFDSGGNLENIEEPIDGGELPTSVVTPYGNYIKYSSENKNVSLKDYIDARVQEDIVKATNNIINLEKPLVPTVPSKLARMLMKLKIPGGPTKVRIPEETAVWLCGYEKNPHTCINTTTGMFPKGSQVSGNKTFAKNPSLYGFKEVNDMQVGDMMQLYNSFDDPFHSVMITGFAENGDPLLTYSNGGIDRDDNNNGIIDEDEKHMRYNQNNLRTNENGFSVVDDSQYNIFRYVGNPVQRQQYKKEYNKLFK